MARKAIYERGRRIFAAMAAGFMLLAPGIALGATEVVPLERLHVHDVIFLPTVRSQFVADFTRPRTWQVSSATVHVEFQHSHELLPNRSWLQVIVNDKLIKHIPLTHENEDGTKLDLPVPPGLLQDLDTLTFRVEQHYTDKCEDPLDKSLWTQILPRTQLVFNYSPVVPQVDLAQYPYPIIDQLTYSPALIHYVVSNHASAQALQAMAIVNANLAQQAQTHEMRTRASYQAGTGPDNEHLVFVGKPEDLPDMAAYQNAFGDYALSGNQWVDRKSNQPLAADQGVILFFQAPGSKEHTVLIVSGNSDQAVLKAAGYLSNRPREAGLTGNAVAVASGWNPSGNPGNKVPRFLENQTRSFKDMGFTSEEVQKINAPPITYHVPVVSDFRNDHGRLWLDLVYSYSPGLNPEYSSLEMRMNDVSIANIPLTNVNGETLARASVPVSNELIKTRNNLVAQFHLMPDKYGWCVDNYVDNAWGKILDDSQFRIEGGPGSRIPDLGLMNPTMYPYSRHDNLEGVQLVVPKDPRPELLDALLAFTTRLGRATQSDTDLRLNVSLGAENIPTDKNVALFRMSNEALQLPNGTRLTWHPVGNGLFKFISLPDLNNAKIEAQAADLGNGVYLEQYLTGGDHVLSVFTASEGSGLTTLSQMLETDKSFDEMVSGFLQQLSLLNPQLNAVGETQFHQEKQNAHPGSWWSNALDWLRNLPWMTILVVMVVAFFFLLVLPVLVRRIINR